MAADSQKIASDILPHMGGIDNIVGVVHCATRLRFSVVDPNKADIERLKSSYGVISAFYKAGQVQVIIGNKVSDVHKQVLVLLEQYKNAGGIPIDGADVSDSTDASSANSTFGTSGDSTSSSDSTNSSGENSTKKEFDFVAVLKSLPSRFISTCSAVFTPIMLMIASAGMMWGLFNIFTTAGWMSETSDFAVLWGTIADAPLFFLPILLGFSAGKKFGSNPYLTACIGAALVYPDLVALAGNNLVIGGLSIKIIGYGKSILPILFAAYVASLLEKFLNKYIPLVVRGFLVPMLCMMIVVPLTLGIIGPLFTAISDGLAKGYAHIPGWLAGTIIGGFWQLVVMFGFHHAFNAIDQININATGFSSMWTYREMSVSSQTGAAFGVYLRTKDKKSKGMMLASVVTGIFGVTEPLLYGITLPRKKVFLMGVVAGCVGGLLVGLIGGGIFVQGGWGILSLLSGIDKDGLQGPAFGTAFFGALIGMVVSFALATILVFITYRDETHDLAKNIINNEVVTDN